jgi:hypothetical protein
LGATWQYCLAIVTRTQSLTDLCIAWQSSQFSATANLHQCSPTHTNCNATLAITSILMCANICLQMPIACKYCQLPTTMNVCPCVPIHRNAKAIWPIASPLECPSVFAYTSISQTSTSTLQTLQMSTNIHMTQWSQIISTNWLPIQISPNNSYKPPILSQHSPFTTHMNAYQYFINKAITNVQQSFMFKANPQPWLGYIPVFCCLSSNIMFIH